MAISVESCVGACAPDMEARGTCVCWVAVARAVFREDGELAWRISISASSCSAWSRIASRSSQLSGTVSGSGVLGPGEVHVLLMGLAGVVGTGSD